MEQHNLGEAIHSTRRFHIGDILSITTGKLVSPRRMEGIYDILNYMTGENLFMHQLPRAGRICKPALLSQFPALSSVVFNPNDADFTATDVATWLAKQAEVFGEYLTITPLNAGDYAAKDPITELSEMMSPGTPMIE